MKIKIYVNDQFYKEMEVSDSGYVYGQLVNQVAQEINLLPGQPFKMQVVKE